MNREAEEWGRAATDGDPVEQLAPLLGLLPCLCFLERHGFIVLQNEAAAHQTRWNSGSRAAEQVFLGPFPFAERPSGHAIASFECLLLRQGASPLPIQGGVRLLPGTDLRLIVAMERRTSDGGQGTFLGDLLDSAPEAIAIAHGGRLLHVNREFSRLFGYGVPDCVGSAMDELLMPAGRMHENETLELMVRTDGRGCMETVRRTRTGAAVDVSLLVAPVKLSGATMGMFYTFRDIRQQKLQEARLHHNALHDDLTGLPNRVLFLDRLRLTMARLRRRPDRRFAVMFLDLDGFKQVNDAMGHEAGDTLLRAVTQRLRDCVRPQDTVARFGGDEFAVLLDEAGSRPLAACVAERIHNAVQHSVVYGGTELFVSVSIGIVIVTPANGDAQSVVREADLAMYQAKAAGKACHAFAADAHCTGGTEGEQRAVSGTSWQ